MIVIVLAAIGYVATLSLVVATYFVGPTDPIPLYLLFAGVFITFVPAVITHPKSTANGGHVSVGGMHVFRTAPIWATVAFGISIVIFLLQFVGSSPDEFQMNAAAFIGRPDRYRFIAAFLMVFFGSSILIKSSGLGAQAQMFAP